MPDHNYSSTENRFGFQAQEEDPELWEGATNYKYRMHNPRTGRFFSVDPLDAKYPYYSSYQFSGNRVIDAIELEGAEPAQFNDPGGDGGTTQSDNSGGGRAIVGVQPEKLPKNTVTRRDGVSPNPVSRGFDPSFKWINDGYINLPENPNLTPGEHVLGQHEGKTKSPYTSASKFFFGADFKGSRYWIDLDKLDNEVFDAKDIKNSLDQFIAAEPDPDLRHSRERRVARNRSNDLKAEAEFLIKGKIPADAVDNVWTLSGKYGMKGLQLYGTAMSVYEMGTAGKKSWDTGSANPILKETVRQSGIWGGAYTGSKLGFSWGSRFGPWGAGIGTAVGGIGGGLLGEEGVESLNIEFTPPTSLQDARQTDGNGTGFCFVEGTKISVGTDSLIDIEDLKSNDKVLSFDLKNQKYGISVISEIKIYETKCTTSVITFDDGSIIESTTEHPYWVIDKGWSAVNPTAIEIDNKKLANLEKGDVCLKYDGQKVIYVKIKDIKLEIKETKVYNLLGVNPFNNYFANKILVHNK
ncbi:MAG: hypothetical protein MK212_14570 [Saprospiraceae bacterium]|nr:hypothetical protein [Saprospiraceae bacterium]